MIFFHSKQKILLYEVGFNSPKVWLNQTSENKNSNHYQPLPNNTMSAISNKQLIFALNCVLE